MRVWPDGKPHNARVAAWLGTVCLIIPVGKILVRILERGKLQERIAE